MPQPQPLQRPTAPDAYSMNPGYHNSPSANSDQPPPYTPTDKLPPARFKILPREEEGREELPAYTCSLHKEAIFDRKMELRNRMLTIYPLPLPGQVS